MATRTFGWIQNPGSLDSLKKVIGAFVYNSSSYLNLIDYKLPLLKMNKLISLENYSKFLDMLQSSTIKMPYVIAKGKGAMGGKRSEALCTGIVQAVLNGQKNYKLVGLNGQSITVKKPYCDDWTTDGYLRWGVSTGLLEYDRSEDNLTVSELGLQLVKAKDGSLEEKKIFSRALLSYPPVYRVLSILSDHNAYTKFEIGSQLGFKGELGFTSIPQEVFIYDYFDAQTSKDRSSIRSNMEGDADKYARMIAGWLTKMGWLKTDVKKVTGKYFGISNTMKLEAWKITREGEKALTMSNGNSKNPRIPKIIKYEMLASKISDCDYVRFRRANILFYLKTAQTIESIQNHLKSIAVDEEIDTIKDDIDNFENIGIRVSYKNNRYRLLDIIEGLDIPSKPTIITKSNLLILKNTVRNRLRHVDHRYLVLFDLAYSDAASKAQKNLEAKEFEIETANLFAKEMGVRAERLGQSNKPDVLIEYGNYGTIIDNKSYKEGLNISAGLRDEMARYVEQNKLRQSKIPPNEWWKWFNKDTKDFTFLYVTSFLKGNFADQLDYIYQLRQVKGAAISVENLLYFTEAIKSGVISKESFFNSFNNNEMIYKIQ